MTSPHHHERKTERMDTDLGTLVRTDEFGQVDLGVFAKNTDFMMKIDADGAIVLTPAEFIPELHVRHWVRATHPYAFRSGEWARIIGLATSRVGRLCWIIEFPDGKNDTWVIDDPVAGYEFEDSHEPDTEGPHEPDTEVDQ